LKSGIQIIIVKGAPALQYAGDIIKGRSEGSLKGEIKQPTGLDELVINTQVTSPRTDYPNGCDADPGRAQEVMILRMLPGT